MACKVGFIVTEDIGNHDRDDAISRRMRSAVPHLDHEKDKGIIEHLFSFSKPLTGTVDACLTVLRCSGENLLGAA
jgi:hypothetical protein